MAVEMPVMQSFDNALALSLARTVRKGGNVFRQNYSYSFFSVWRITLFLQLLTITPEGLIDLDLAYGALYFSIAFGGLLALAIGRAIIFFSSSRPLLIATGLLGSMGIALFSLAIYTPFFLPCFIPVGLAISGACFSLSNVAWLQMFISHGLDAVAWNYLVGAVAGALMFYAVTILPTSCTLALLALAPFLSNALLRNKSNPYLNDGEHEDDHSLEKRIDAIQAPPVFATVRLFIVAFMAAAAFGLVSFQATGSHAIEPSGTLASAVLLDALACFAAKAIASFAYSVRSVSVFLAIIPLICAASILLLITSNPTIATGMYFAVLFAFQLANFMVVFKIAETFKGLAEKAVPGIGILIAVTNASQAAARLLAPTSPTTSTLTIAVLACMVIAALTIAGNAHSFALQGEPRDSDKRDQIEKIHALARAYQLSPREVDVMELWGTGHTSSYIEEQLYIAKSTVKTHLSHIYEKTGTASKEELLQLIEKQ